MGYVRGTVANAESGHPWVTLRFWARCDELLYSDGWLVRGYRGVLTIEDQMRADERAQRTAHAAHRAMQALSTTAAGGVKAQPDVAVLNRRVPVRLRLQQAQVRAQTALRLLRISARQNAAGRECS